MPVRAMRCLLVLGAVAWGSWGQGATLPLFLRPVLPAAPANRPACASPTDPLEVALWQVVTANGQPDLSCDNVFTGFLRTPRGPGTPLDAYQITASEVVNARNEVLLANMEWNAGPGHPGWTFVQAVAELYGRVRADPSAYPHGMTVRVLLGGFPDLLHPDGKRQPLALLDDLLRLGVPLQDARVGWTLTLLNYRYFPHSHVKLHIIDGRDLTVAGYNYTDWHLPSSEPGGHGLHDLGLRMSGPVAQSGVATFDDLWRHSSQLRCPDAVTRETAAARCRLTPPDPVTHPAAAREAVAAGHARAFMLYRRPGSDEADRAHLALLGATQRQLDLMQADFGPTMNCWGAYLNPQGCGPETWPVYLTAVLEAIRRGVHVRLLTVDYGTGAAANRSGVTLLRQELRHLGLQDRFEARYVTFNMHSKALTVDRRMVVVGSMNFHFSSWGQLGLAEAALATADPAAVSEQEASFETVWQTASRPVPDEWWLKNVVPEPAPGP
ncbi:phospholipase D-like domain-containing protein [Deinococcus humi]|uniref:phospholipase D n=1 Tax=Deinococcus humi TaxID=662880 RepID=A0A7W8NBZ9_9DEIO|nr:phospholipase D-like domain-containing protein [Deinococcus humi]MBB5361664.1 phosphatidylserine/phosphatidylglycerophosphate/cardiolipin synthase-like enzyme [Deinococcus humi]